MWQIGSNGKKSSSNEAITLNPEAYQNRVALSVSGKVVKQAANESILRWCLRISVYEGSGSEMKVAIHSPGDR